MCGRLAKRLAPKRFIADNYLRLAFIPLTVANSNGFEKKKSLQNEVGSLPFWFMGFSLVK